MKSLSNYSQNAHWFLRIALASVFIYHGLGKFPMLSGCMAKMTGLPSNNNFSGSYGRNHWGHISFFRWGSSKIG